MRFITRLAVVGSAIGLGALTAVPALASPATNVSFFAQGSATAQWLPSQSAIQVTVPSSSSYAVIVFHHVSATAPSSAPAFTAVDASGNSMPTSGSPRWYIQFSSGGYLFGYPAPEAFWAVNACGAGTNSYDSGSYQGDYAAALAAVNGYCPGTVTGVYIVNDSSQSTPYTDTIAGIQYNGIMYTNS